MTSISDRDDLEHRLTVMLNERAESVVVDTDPDDVLAHTLVAGAQHSSRRWMLVAAAATIVVLALGVLVVADEPDSLRTGTVPSTPASSVEPTSLPLTAPSTAPVATVSATTTEAATTPTTTTAPTLASTLPTPVPTLPTLPTVNGSAPGTAPDVSLPSRLDPSEAAPSYGIEDLLPDYIPRDRLALAIDAVLLAGTHLQGHEILGGWNQDGTIMSSGDEILVGCAENAMDVSHLAALVDDAITTFVAEGLALSEISAADVFERMMAIDTPVFATLLDENQYFLLRCGGVPESAAFALANL